jgi:hypothetical protein
MQCGTLENELFTNPLATSASYIAALNFLGFLGMKKLVAGDGIEPPTQGFSILCSTN